MLWVIRPEWPTGARFCFNCYQHHAILVDHGAIRKSVILSSQEGKTQGDLYSVSEFPAAKQQRLADDGSAARYCADICAQLSDLQLRYIPESSTSILEVTPHHVEQAKAEFTS